MTELKFGGQPPVEAIEQARFDWVAIARQLAANPGEWAQVSESMKLASARSKASQARKGRGVWANGVYDGRVEELEDGRARLWLMCISPDAPGATDVTQAPEPATESGEEVPGVPF